MGSESAVATQNAVGKQTLGTTADATTAATPGKRTLADQMPALTGDVVTRVKAYAGETIADGGGYTFRVLDAGTFEVIATPPGRDSAKRAIMTPDHNAHAWQVIAQQLLARPPVKPAPIAKPAMAASVPAPVPAPAPPTQTSWFARAATAVEAELDELHQDASSIWSRAKSLLPSNGTQVVKPTPTASPTPSTSTNPSPTAQKPAAPAAPAPAPAAKKPTSDNKWAEGMDTLDIATTRVGDGFGVGGTEYTLYGLDPDETKRAAEIHAKLDPDAAARQAIATAKQKKQPPPPPSPDLLADADRTQLETELAALVKHANQRFARELASGGIDQKQFYCSGLSLWTLAAAGYDLSAKLCGSDKEPFYAERGKDKIYATLKKLVDGEPESVEVMTRAKGRDKGGSVGPLLGTGYQTEPDGAGLPVAARGAAGAFALAGIGEEVPELAQKPGDFAQARHSTAGKGTDTEVKHRGAGHAWQVTEIRVKGNAMFGQPGSPKGAAPGWQEGVEFTIDHATDPALVGEHVISAANRIEAQVAQRSMKGDTAHDGGVQLTGMQPVPDANPMKYSDNVVFYGRLGTSKWHGWNAATRASAEARKADAIAPLPAPAPAPASAPAATDADTNSTRPAAAQPAGELPADVGPGTAVA